MCDYSLEAYRSRPAREGEEYVTHRFSSGSIGFIAPGDPMTAVCMAFDTRIALANLPEPVQSKLGVRAAETVTFARLENGWFEDGVRFANSAEISLQRLGPGVRASVADALVEPRRREVAEAL